MAVFALPAEMMGFFKKHIDYVTDHAIDPDKRSRSVEGEQIKHYIDIDHYGDMPFEIMPKTWKDACSKYTKDTLELYGINPWWMSKMVFSLSQAFRDEDLDKILWTAANLGHYVADATVPLHTSQYYDGRTLEQKGIHAFWETRVPELFGDKFNYMVGKAEYMGDPLETAWALVKESHYEIDTVMAVLDYMTNNYPDDKKYVYDEKGAVIAKQFSAEYTAEFSKRMNNMCERKMQRAVKMVASIWYTAWVNAGQPDLSRLDDKAISKQHKKELQETEKMWRTGKPVGRQNPGETQ
jgi:hypothetical protein